MSLYFVRGDITRVRADAIVNAANTSLLGGGGVDGAIHRAAGPGLLAECRTLGGCRVGEARCTGGYHLPCKYVIHTVGPVWRGGTQDEAKQLAACYRNSLALAREKGCASVAFPLISTGAFGYPREEAVRIAVREIEGFLWEDDMEVYLVVYDRAPLLEDAPLLREVRRFLEGNAPDEARENAARRERWEAPLEDADYGLTSQADACSMPPAPSAPTARSEAPDAQARRTLESGGAVRARLRRSADLAARDPRLEALLAHPDESFAEMLFRKIDERGMTDVDCYKKANLDRKLFSKIRSNPEYRPSKPTAVALAVALRLSLEDTRELLARAGYALSRSSRFDIIVEYCIERGEYDVYEINSVLFAYDMPLLGAS